MQKQASRSYFLFPSSFCRYSEATVPSLRVSGDCQRNKKNEADIIACLTLKTLLMAFSNIDQRETRFPIHSPTAFKARSRTSGKQCFYSIFCMLNKSITRCPLENTRCSEYGDSNLMIAGLVIQADEEKSRPAESPNYQ
jgi:hypothetical protein